MGRVVQLLQVSPQLQSTQYSLLKGPPEETGHETEAKSGRPTLAWHSLLLRKSPLSGFQTIPVEAMSHDHTEDADNEKTCT